MSAQAPILLVDDNAGKRLALKAILAPLGCVVVEADSGRAALRCIMAQDFAVILLDVCMPIMDGFETAEFIRQRRQSEMTPIIFITAYATDEILPTSRYVQGAVDFIFAPVNPDELRAKVSVFVNLFSKAEELASEARKVQTSADQLRLLTDAAPIGIFRTDASNRYVYTNPRWSEITGIPADEADGREWDAIIDSQQRAAFVADSADLVVSPSERSHRFEIRQANSETRFVLVTSRSVPSTDGGQAGWVGTVADVTAETGAAAAMADARDKATEALQLKSDFLANMSHEIRTPMNGVLGMTDLLLDTELDNAQRDYVETVRTCGEALMVIINDILDFSKADAGGLHLARTAFSVHTVVEEVVHLLLDAARAKGLEVAAVVDRSVPSLVDGDASRVAQVLHNFVGNAIKFTSRGRISVQVTDLTGAGTDTMLRFQVSDTGVGIAPDKLSTVFQPFVQADSSNSRQYGGTGLGLALSDQLVTLMGGTCGASSQLGNGSTFWFTIPVQPAGSAATQDSSAAASVAQ